jgi:hypothetical protein
MSERNCPYYGHPDSWHNPLGCQFSGCNCHQTAYLLLSNKVEELQAERDALAKQLEVACGAMENAKDNIFKHNSIRIIHADIDDAFYILACALAKIERLSANGETSPENER